MSFFHEERTLPAQKEFVDPLLYKADDVTLWVANLRLQDIIGTNLLTKFHEDRKINVASRVLTWKNAPPPGGHVFLPTSIIFKLIQDIIRMNLLPKFHEDRTINVASRELTRFYYSHKEKCPAPWHPYIIETNLLTKFHEDWTINVASRVFTRLYYSHIRKNAPPRGGHIFQPTGIIFELVQDIIGMNLLTKFHEDQTINVASREKNAPPLGSHVFQANTNLLTKFHEDWTINVASREKNAPPLGSHVFQANVTIFKLVQDIIETNLLTKFHED
ncbi:hypothetical protein DPMN_116078 [Dreissena polymorpha]|uniref:Uncharacterized protein n=1 Tax=Dreissena polymorpha TaxID=45954 RepID=A0A9D4QT31_DREPO|nr:hypothetical protein DPMN_116078 [Dreissena polymorpha]